MTTFSSLDVRAVRQALLAAQGLLSPPPEGKPDGEVLLNCIRRMGYLQIDTIQIVARSQYLVLWSRLGHYDPALLDAVHAHGALFEYYAHALCLIPIADYPWYRALMLDPDLVRGGRRRWAKDHPEVIARVREFVHENGPVSSADFDSQRLETGWGGVKAERIALDYLFSVGELMIPYRRNFRRFYDLRQRVLPDWEDSRAPDSAAARRALLTLAVRCLGLARADWVAPYLHFKKTGIPAMLEDLAAEGALGTAVVSGWDQPVYFHPDQEALVRAAARGDLLATHSTLLSPFDPLISDRDRTADLFGFDFKLEAYTPLRERQYGYFCLPILYNGRLVGRLDPKAHREERRMEIKNIFLEPDFTPGDDFVFTLRKILADFTAWHGMEDLTVSRCESAQLAEALT
jgi:uncharacterized protein